MLFNEPNERATPGAEKLLLNSARLMYIFDAKLINYIYIIGAGWGFWIKYFINARNFGKAHILSILKPL